MSPGRCRRGADLARGSPPEGPGHGHPPLAGEDAGSARPCAVARRSHRDWQTRYHGAGSFAHPRESASPQGGIVVARNLSRGSFGEDVRAVQDMLNYHLRRETPLVLDGRFGTKTEARVKQFQRGVKLRDDGIVGALTNAELFELHVYSAQVILLPPLTLPTIGVGAGGFGIQPPRLIPPLVLPTQPQLVLTPPIQFMPAITLKATSAATFSAVKQPSVLNISFTVVPSKDPTDPVIRSTQNILKLINDLPVDSKFKAFLVAKVPNPISVISEPRNSLSFSPFSPSYNPFDPNKIGNTANAAFSLRLFGKPGDPTPQIALQGRAEGKVELEYTGRAASSFFKFSSEWNFALGLGGTF
jgi:peptidoglycan hydrolase-like protein with peptidoglycan-binding domain